ncbi:MAG TPA: lipoyl synthase [Planctomycetes bacterium]|nr:lipoyl synthase [Planctomycetota bacterium]HIN81033.1 lipoyl synthase [Planctomycetota bacterium]
MTIKAQKQPVNGGARGGTRGKEPLPRPQWLRIRVPSGDALQKVTQLMDRGGLHTVCQEAHCPNIHECWAMGTATFLILGEICTRKCGFCAVSKGIPTPVDPDEPQQLASTVSELGLQHVVITSVDRDDLSDGGARQFSRCIEALRSLVPETTTEVLVPDFRPDPDTALGIVLAADPTIFSHNLETVRRLYPAARPGSDYDLSLSLLEGAVVQIGGSRVKSSLILGLGERKEELEVAIADLYRIGVRRLNLGQYLAPSEKHIPVKKYYPPREFDALGAFARELGFEKVESGPLVRSSYHASV